MLRSEKQKPRSEFGEALHSTPTAPCVLNDCLLTRVCLTFGLLLQLRLGAESACSFLTTA